MNGDIAARSRKAALELQVASCKDKSAALRAIHNQLQMDKDLVFSLNEKDLASAEALVSLGQLSLPLIKRLDLRLPGKWESILAGILQIKGLDDPTGKIQLASLLDDGLKMYRVSCPIGVLLVIFEARPEVVVQISCLAIKSGNAVILKGGKEANQTNDALFKSIQTALRSLPENTRIPSDSVQLVSTREEISNLLKLDKYIDLVIPRGSKSLVQYVQENTRIPVLGHADGLCSIYVDESADEEKAKRLIIDSKVIYYSFILKTNYPAACNSAETLLIHSSREDLLVKIAQELSKYNVIIKADEKCFNILSRHHSESNFQKAIDSDFDTEFLDLKISIKIVSNLKEAIDHINTHGSKHTELVITEDKENAHEFMSLVDAAGVFWNASTRFADGFRYGFGAEIGVSTNKTHARGPVGLEGLMIYKYKIFGDGHIVEDYSSGKLKFKHLPIDK